MSELVTAFLSYFDQATPGGSFPESGRDPTGKELVSYGALGAKAALNWKRTLWEALNTMSEPAKRKIFQAFRATGGGRSGMALRNPSRMPYKKAYKSNYRKPVRKNVFKKRNFRKGRTSRKSFSKKKTGYGTMSLLLKALKAKAA